MYKPKLYSPVANPLVTAICVSRGNDDDFHLVAKMLGKQEGLWLAEYLEYNWEGFPTLPNRLIYVEMRPDAVLRGFNWSGS